MFRLRFYALCLACTALVFLTGCPKKAPQTPPASTTPEVVKESNESGSVEKTEAPAKSGKPSAIIEINGQDHFLKFVEETPIAVIDFSAHWCGPCRRLVPELEKIATEYKEKGVKIGRVDVDKNQTVAQAYNVRGIPDIRIFVKGKATETVVGFNPQKLYKAIEKAVVNFDKPIVDYGQTPLEDELWPDGK